MTAATTDAPTATSTTALPSPAEIEDNFAFLDDWEDRYRYVIELGRMMPPLAEDEKSELNKVSGCASQVWLVTRVDEAGTLHARAESDAHIVQGLLAILMSLADDRPKEEVAASDPHAFFETIGLAANLTKQRANGLASVIGRLKAEASV